MGGPVQKDKTFIFANYEGFREALNQTSVAFVPDTNSRAEAPLLNPLVNKFSLMNLWPAPPTSPQGAGACPNPTDTSVFTDNNHVVDGIQNYCSSPLQSIREDFGTARLDHTFSSRDSASAVYTIDDSYSNTATVADPYASDIIALREQVFSLQENHVFSPDLVNTARLGFSRAGYFFTGEPTPGTPAFGLTPFISTAPFIGAVTVGGSQASNPQTQVGLAGSNNGSNLLVARNLFTYADQASWLRGRHQLTGGVWFQRFQSNEELALSQYGQMGFSGLNALVQGTASLLYDPTPTLLGWRSLLGAAFAQDTIRVTSRLTASVGFRYEFNTGWSEEAGRAANYAILNNVMQCQSATGACLPVVGSSLFAKNRATLLAQPRLGVAWSPLGKNTVIRAGFGIYNDMQDALGYRADQNAPYNPTYTVTATTGNTPITPPTGGASFPGTLIPGGVQPDMYSPTLESWSLRVEQQLSPNTSFTVGYVGNHAYHELIGVDENAPQPIPCAGAACQINLTTFSSTGVATTVPVTLPTGTPYIPTGTAKPNARLSTTWTWMSEGDSSYNALQVDLNRRFSSGLTVRGVYTWSKTLDDGDSYNATAAGNDVALASNPYNVRADWGLATFDVRNVGVMTATYALPFGHGQHWLSGRNGIEGGLVGGWTVNSIVTLQDGFPFTPQLSYNPSNDGDTRNPVRPFVNPGFSGSPITGNPSQWFNPQYFAFQSTTSGFFGNLGRNTLIGPGLATWDFSVLKDTHIRESVNLQFRAEIFNLLDRANFNTPNLVLAVSPTSGTVPLPSPTAGVITGTSTSSRQVQFGLKLLW